MSNIDYVIVGVGPSLAEVRDAVRCGVVADQEFGVLTGRNPRR